MDPVLFNMRMPGLSVLCSSETLLPLTCTALSLHSRVLKQEIVDYAMYFVGPLRKADVTTMNLHKIVLMLLNILFQCGKKPHLWINTSNDFFI